MNPLWYVIGGLVLVLLVVMYRQSSGGWRPPSIDNAVGPQLSLPGDVRERVELLLAQGKKIEAIKEVRTVSGIGLKEAKDYVEGLASGFRPPTIAAGYAQPVSAGVIALSPDAEREVRREIAAGNKIMAIKIVREASGAGLKEAKDFVEAMAAGVLPAIVPAPPARPRLTGGVIALSPDAEREVRSVLATGNKIAAIKLVRQASGAGLKEAKDFVDRM
ncbi:MAG TPA: ribosomal protein L7/L12 [Herpetosiphonaceae bacterium]|nr:ribosomal protein L7/L12 [Herpetosiphonaceae bacterium]